MFTLNTKIQATEAKVKAFLFEGKFYIKNSRILKEHLWFNKITLQMNLMI